ncbi:MAG: hypothetical protein U0840_10315 [Gemmataceae bacterium]
MSELDVEVRLERSRYQPRHELIGAFQIVGDPPSDYTVELSVLWRTEGKGDEDLGVILFQEWTSASNPLAFDQPHEFSVRLPRSPLTYDGELIKIRWLARVRVRWGNGHEEMAQEEFELGSNPETA